MDGQSVILTRHIYLLNHINQTDRHIHTPISNGSLKHESNNFSPPIRFFCTIICVVKLLRHYLLDISCEKDTRINRYRLLLQTKLRRFEILAAENKIKGILKQWRSKNKFVYHILSVNIAMCPWKIHDVSLSEWPESLICTLITLQVWIFFFNIKKKTFQYHHWIPNAFACGREHGIREEDCNSW